MVMVMAMDMVMVVMDTMDTMARDLLMPSLAMATTALDMVMVMAMDMVMVVMDTTTEREPLMLRLSQDTVTMAMVMDMDTMDMGMVMDTMDTMARDLLMLMPSQLPLLSQDMDTMAMDMVMDMDTVMVMAMVDTDTTTARELPMLSQAMDTMDMVTDMDMDTTDKQLKSFLLSSLEFSTKNEIGPFGTSHFQTFPKLSINYFLY